MRRLAALGLALICPSCGSDSEPGGDPASALPAQADKLGGSAQWEHETYDGEPGKLVLWGLRSGNEGISIRIYSEGCTSRGDVKIVVYESLPPKLLFVRAQPDRCQRPGQYPNGVELTFRWSELGIKQQHGFKVLNRVELP